MLTAFRRWGPGGSTMFRHASAIAAALLAMAAPLMAADALEHAPEVTYDWSGIYIGLGTGAGGLVHEVGIPLFDTSFNGIGAEGLLGEFTVGYDHMLSERMLLGAYGTARLGGVKSGLSALGGTLTGDITADYGFDLIARAGYLVRPETLVYVLGGYSYQHFELSSNVGFSDDWESNGFTAGFGLETALSDRLSLKGEYRYSQYAAFDLVSLGGIDVESEPSSHTFHVGLNYRFGVGAPAAASQSSGPSTVSWTGLYVTGSAGGSSLVHELGMPLFDTWLNGIGGEGVSGSFGVGYDHEFSNGFVAGIQADIRFASTATTLDVVGLVDGSIDAHHGYDIIGRIGYKPVASTLVYALGGWTRQDFEIGSELTGSLYDWSANGLTVGAGIETAVTESIFVGAEYRYSVYETEDVASAGILEIDPSSHTVSATLKYKFN
jgi:outer membrane immunogenic protein